MTHDIIDAVIIRHQEELDSSGHGRYRIVSMESVSQKKGKRPVYNRPVLSCYDSLYDDSIQVGWRHACASLTNDPSHRFSESLGEFPEAKWQRKLVELGASHLKILNLEYESPSAGYRFRLVDAREGYEFSYYSWNLYAHLSKDPMYQFKLGIPIKEYYQTELDSIVPDRFEVSPQRV